MYVATHSGCVDPWVVNDSSKPCLEGWLVNFFFFEPNPYKSLTFRNKWVVDLWKQDFRADSELQKYPSSKMDRKVEGWSLPFGFGQNKFRHPHPPPLSLRRWSNVLPIFYLQSVRSKTRHKFVHNSRFRYGFSRSDYPISAKKFNWVPIIFKVFLPRWQVEDCDFHFGGNFGAGCCAWLLKIHRVSLVLTEFF